MSYLLGLIGHPVSHSLSPAMHKAALAHFGMPGDYKLFDIAPANLSQRLKALHGEGLSGFNVTIPHKLAVFSLCRELSQEATNVGAVNTVRFLADGGMHGHNTDLIGFAGALDAVWPAQGHGGACVLGAGGAAKAAILALRKRGVSDISIIVRNPEKAEEMLRDLSASSSSSSAAEPSTGPSKQIKIIPCEDVATICNVTLIVNTLPIGQTILQTPSWVEKLLESCQGEKPFVFDMVYSRTGQPTPLTALAAQRQLNACDGAEMLIRQAASAFQFWTGKLPPVDLMRATFTDQQQKNSRE